MSIRRLCLLLTVGLVAGCTTTNQLPSTSFAQPAALEQAMKRYYEAHATEQWGYCSTPYIDGLTQVQVVDNQPDKLVVDVRYLYRDRQKDGRAKQLRPRMRQLRRPQLHPRQERGRRRHGRGHDRAAAQLIRSGRSQPEACRACTRTKPGAEMSTRCLCLSLIALLAGCSTGRLPGTSFAEPAALERAMERYYAAHATEQYGYCSTPHIDGLTQVRVVDNQPQRLVVDVRYFYQDRQKANSLGHECTGYGGRSFTFGKGEAGGVDVVEMTGPRRS